MDDSAEKVYTVTEVRASQRMAGLYCVVIDADTAFLCPDDVVVRWNLRRGLNLSAAEVEQLRAEADEVKARRLALDMVALSPRSAHELQTALRRKGASADAAEKAVSRLAELGYVDDGSYAVRLVERMERQGSLGVNRMREELAKRGLNRQTAQEALAVVSDESERERALALAQKRLRGSTVADKAAVRRLAGYLQRRGFEWSTIRWCLEQLAEVDTQGGER